MTKKSKQRKKSRALYLLIAGLVMLLLFVNLVASNRLSTAGEKLKNLEKQIAKLESENLSLELKIAQAGSIPSLIQQAQELGFVYSSQAVYLRGEVPVAMR